jgi:hypothetical protein
MDRYDAIVSFLKQRPEEATTITETRQKLLGLATP